ncbi:MAG: hypothetical protein M3R17_11555 [Bacteroidota bacterium]|nr:hypothetical protein [Bacteroidota bacterium]
MANEEKKPWYKRPLVLISVAAGAIGFGGLGFWVYKKSQRSAEDDNNRTGKTGNNFDSAG